MSYASTSERDDLIKGLHAVADFLSEHPEVPAPRWVDLMVFPDGSDSEIQAEVDEIAAQIGAPITDATHSGDHYTTSHAFGPVQYRAIAIPASSRKKVNR